LVDSAITAIIPMTANAITRETGQMRFLVLLFIWRNLLSRLSLPAVRGQRWIFNLPPVSDSHL
jgi:hypothetical protein